MEDGKLLLDHLPFRAGLAVEVIVLPANRYLRRFRRQTARLTPANPVGSSTRVPGSGVTTVSNASANCAMANSPRQNKTAFIVPS